MDLGQCWRLSCNGPLAQGVCYQPLLRLLRGKALNKQEKGALRGLVAGGEWPACKLAARGIIEGSQCRSCGAADGTAKHRHAGCPDTRAHLPAWERLYQLHDQGLGSDLFWDRCLVPRMLPLLGRPVLEDNEVWEVPTATHWGSSPHSCRGEVS